MCLLLLGLMEAYIRLTVTKIAHKNFILENYQNRWGNSETTFSPQWGSWCFVFKWSTETTYKPFFSVCCRGVKIWWGLHLLEVSRICLFCQCIVPQNDCCTAQRSETESSPSTSCWWAISWVFGDCTGETCSNTKLVKNSPDTDVRNSFLCEGNTTLFLKAFLKMLLYLVLVFL